MASQYELLSIIKSGFSLCRSPHCVEYSDGSPPFLRLTFLILLCRVVWGSVETEQADSVLYQYWLLRHFQVDECTNAAARKCCTTEERVQTKIYCRPCIKPPGSGKDFCSISYRQSIFGVVDLKR